MGERRSGRFRFGRAEPTAVDPPSPADEAPCLPCAQQTLLRPFALNADVAPVADDLVPSLVADVAHAITDGEVVLFDPRRATSTLLNSSAALIWASIDGVSTIAEIVDDLTEETGADRTTIDADVRATVARFIQGGIVEGPTPGADTQPGSPSAVDPVGAAEARPGTDPERRAGRRQARVARVLERRSWLLHERRWCAGAAVEVRTDSDELAALLAPALALLPPADATSSSLSIIDRGPGSTRRFRIIRDAGTSSFVATAPDAVATAFTVLNDIAIHGSPGRLVLHAGAVERDGSVVVVAGPSGRGKSTLTAALVQRGFGYLTDEVVAIDPRTHDVLPYPKPIDLDRSSAALLGIEAPRDDDVKGKVPVARLGSVSTGGRLRLLVLLDDPRSPTPPSTSTAEQLIELLTNTFSSTFHPSTATADPLGALAALAEQVAVVHVSRSVIDDSCRTIETHLRAIDRAPAS